MNTIDRLRDIAGDYDLFLVDQWGVLHNGEALHSGARESLQALRREGKSIVLISNSSKRASVSEEALDTLGIERALYDGIVTSGEVAWQQMYDRSDPFYARLGRRCFLVAWQPDNRFLDGQTMEQTEDLGDADFILLAGTTGAPVSEYEDFLQAAIQRKLPLVCLNRDMVSVDPEGNLIDCGGKVAARYEALGGAVRYNGKPGQEMYAACMARAPSSQRPLAIGDSLLHDIAGANGAAIDSVLVTGGIHADELGVRPGVAPAPDRLSAVCAEYGARPTYVMYDLVW